MLKSNVGFGKIPKHLFDIKALVFYFRVKAKTQDKGIYFYHHIYFWKLFQQLR